jgi:hypothetical protein
MLVKVKKAFGLQNEKVVVLSTKVEFVNGEAEVSPEIGDVLARIPGYEVEPQEAEGEEAPVSEESENQADMQATIPPKQQRRQRATPGK